MASVAAVMAGLLVAYRSGRYFGSCRGPVPAANSVAIPSKGEVRGAWEARNLSVNYSMRRAHGMLDISGSIDFDRNFALSFNEVRAFHVRIIFLDARGNVLDTGGLASAAYVYPGDGLPFRTTKEIPTGAQSVAFSYTGEAYSSGGGGRAVTGIFESSC